MDSAAAEAAAAAAAAAAAEAKGVDADGKDVDKDEEDEDEEEDKDSGKAVAGAAVTLLPASEKSLSRRSVPKAASAKLPRRCCCCCAESPMFVAESELRELFVVVLLALAALPEGMSMPRTRAALPVTVAPPRSGEPGAPGGVTLPLPLLLLLLPERVSGGGDACACVCAA